MSSSDSATRRGLSELSLGDEPSAGHDDRLQQVSQTFDYFKPAPTLLATTYMATVQTPYFNGLQGFCASMIAGNTLIYEQFEDMLESWDVKVLGLITAYQESIQIFNQYKGSDAEAQDAANALRNVCNKIEFYRENSPYPDEASQRNPKLAAEIILFILEEVLERTMPYIEDLKLYEFLIAEYAEKRRFPWLYENILNLPSHIPPRHEVRIRRIMYKQSLLSHKWVDQNIMGKLADKLSVRIEDLPSEGPGDDNEGSSEEEEEEEEEGGEASDGEEEEDE